MRSSFFFMPVLLWLSSCGTGNNQQHSSNCPTEECRQAYDRVMVVHDAVMPKLADIRKLQQAINNRMATTTDSLALAGWEELNRQLTEADKAMWVWMRQFNSDLTDMPATEALNYLQQEQRKINTVAEKINAAIAGAEKKLAVDN